jgi:hypothetical protein
MKFLKRLFGIKDDKSSLVKHIEPESFTFVKNLSECSVPSIHERWSLGYIYAFSIVYPDGIRINVEYNDICGQWKTEIWSGETSSFFYYKDVSRSATNYLIERYNLVEKLKKALSIKQLKEEDKLKKEQEIKNKYLK